MSPAVSCNSRLAPDCWLRTMIVTCAQPHTQHWTLCVLGHHARCPDTQAASSGVAAGVGSSAQPGPGRAAPGGGCSGGAQSAVATRSGSRCEQRPTDPAPAACSTAGRSRCEADRCCRSTHKPHERWAVLIHIREASTVHWFGSAEKSLAAHMDGRMGSSDLLLHCMWLGKTCACATITGGTIA